MGQSAYTTGSNRPVEESVKEDNVPNILVDNNITFSTNGKEVLKLDENGDIFVKGNLVENDKDVVDTMREFLNNE